MHIVKYNICMVTDVAQIKISYDNESNVMYDTAAADKNQEEISAIPKTNVLRYLVISYIRYLVFYMS